MYAICGDCKEEREEMQLVDASRFKGADIKEGGGYGFVKWFCKVWA